MRKKSQILPVLLLIVFGGFSLVKGENNDMFQRRWNHVSENSAVIYWQLDSISKVATSYVEYGNTEDLGQQTAETEKPRWVQFHRINGLETGVTYYYRMVVNMEGKRFESEILQFTPQQKENAYYIPQDLPGGPPYMLYQNGATYVLTEDITASGTAIIVQGGKITLDLNGHTVVYGNNTSSQVFGVQINSEDSCKVVNGRIVQGERSGDYSNAIRSFKSSNFGVEICGISTDVHLDNAQPMVFRHDQLEVHHNDIYSRVINLESRHWPGNVMLRIDAAGKNVYLHDNLLTEGCHRAILIGSGTLSNVEINHNDIRHHQQYVNGYAIAPGSGAKVHHNKITSTGRGVHLTGQSTEFYNNYIDIQGHQHLSDLPSGSRPFKHQLVELHGIKLEGSNTKNCKIYNNFVRITQPQPVDSGGKGDPEDKIENGVYFHATATSIEDGLLIDNSQSWENDRWRLYYVKYDPGKPAVQITGNDATTLYGDFEATSSLDYTVYMVWKYVPPTPLNVACYDPNGMNEIYDNTFIGITTYENTRHGGYGDSGEWSTGIMFIGMDEGPADPGKYSAYIHDNEFYSNDLFVNSSGAINMDIQVENNTFTYTDEPIATMRNYRIHNVGETFENHVRANNQFIDATFADIIVNTSDIAVYPNPATHILTVTGQSDWLNNGKVWLYSPNGRKIYETADEVQLPHKVDISSCLPGMYFIKVSKNRKNFVKKIIIK
jgi:hypothetical protein